VFGFIESIIGLIQDIFGPLIMGFIPKMIWILEKISEFFAPMS